MRFTVCTGAVKRPKPAGSGCFAGQSAGVLPMCAKLSSSAPVASHWVRLPAASQYLKYAGGVARPEPVSLSTNAW